MRVYHIDALTETVDMEMNVKEVRTLLKAIGSKPEQETELLNIGSQLFSISSMFRELENLV